MNACAAKPDRCLSLAQWQSEREAYLQQVRPLVEAQKGRHGRGQSHPVIDFLFQYNGIRPGRLLHWSPGVGVALQWPQSEAPPGEGWHLADGWAWLVTQSLPPKRRARLQHLLAMQQGIAARAPRFACYGLHEWAMLDDLADQRHRQLPLRLAHAEQRRVLRQLSLCCSHFDAYRHFSASALPLNQFTLTAEDRMQRDQPGCLHVNMDLFRWAQLGFPWLSSALVADSLALALALRELDMRASPYDVRDYGLTAIAIETRAGRLEYQARQRQLAARAAALRTRLLQELHRVLA